MTTSYTGPFHQNRLLASLPPGTVARLSPHLQPFTFTFGKALLDPGDGMPDIYFPLSGMVSVITVMLTGTALETRLVGSEGMAPLEALLGVERAPQRLLIQAGGEALRLPAFVLREQARGTGRCTTCLSATLRRRSSRPRRPRPVTDCIRSMRALRAGCCWHTTG